MGDWLQGDDNLKLQLFAFLLFEFSVGVYFPSIGVLKGEVVPENVRATIYSLYRVPLNGIVIGLLLSDASLRMCFMASAFLILMAILSILAIMRMPVACASSLDTGSDSEESIRTSSFSTPVDCRWE